MVKKLKQHILTRVRSRLEKTNPVAPQFVSPGHFYSTIPSLTEVMEAESRIFRECQKNIPGIDMNEEGQRQLIESCKQYYADLPFTEGKSPELRYYFDNKMYSYSDAITLYCMIRHLRPKRIVEVGSGFSSCITLDTNEKFFANKIACTFIEPYPERLLSLLHPGDQERIEIHQKRLQYVDLEIFDQLEENDILFLDSTHVSKVGSDVNRIFFEILPRLASGVNVHFHDIFYPFEYPKDWIYSGRAWNEAYLLRAFLQYNNTFKVILMNTYLHKFHSEFFDREMPLCNKNTGGSIWIRKI